MIKIKSALKIAIRHLFTAAATLGCLWSVSALASNPQIRSCQNAQVQAIALADQSVTARLSTLSAEFSQFNLNYVKVNFIDAEQRLFDPSSPRNAAYTRYHSLMVQNLNAMKASIDRGVQYQCEDDRVQPICQNGEVYAYVMSRFGRSYPPLHLCSGFFKNKDSEEQARTIVHELSHYAANTEDYAYEWLNTNGELNLPHAAMDAYHFENFYSAKISQQLRRDIWFWLWPRKPNTI